MAGEREFAAQFGRLRAGYDVAFRAYCRAIAELQAIETPREGAVSLLQAREQVEATRRACNNARNRLAVLLLDRKLEKAYRVLSRRRDRGYKCHYAGWETLAGGASRC